jgi:hypothetical protein
VALYYAVCWSALGMSIVSFAVFVRLSLRGATKVGGLTAVTETAQPRGNSGNTELVGVLHRLTGNMQNIGPAIGALSASILFFIVAIIGTALDIIAR